MSDLISRQAAIELSMQYCPDDDGTCSKADEDIRNLLDELEGLPSVQPEPDREFIKLTVRNSNGRPYYSIIYLEVDDNGVGHDFEGYSSYSLDVISDYLKKYFMLSVKPTYTDEQIQKMQDLESAEIEKAYQLGYEEGKSDAQPERKTGKWIDNETSFADGVRQTCTCSVCGIRSVRPLGSFCRWCGARMEVDADD